MSGFDFSTSYVPSSGRPSSHTVELSTGGDPFSCSVLLLFNDPGHEAASFQSSSASSLVETFNEPTLPPGGYLFYRPQALEGSGNSESMDTQWCGIHASKMVLIGLTGEGGEEEEDEEDRNEDEGRVWMQVETSDEDTMEVVVRGGDVKSFYKALTDLSDRTEDQSENSGAQAGNGGDDDNGFAAFCNAVNGGQTGFIGGQVEGQFDDE